MLAEVFSEDLPGRRLALRRPARSIFKKRALNVGRFINLLHVSPRKNAASIRRQGILLSRSKGKMQVIWLYKYSLSGWVIPHIAKHHGVRTSDLAVFSVRVHSNDLRHAYRRGVYFCLADVTEITELE